MACVCIGPVITIDQGLKRCRAYQAVKDNVSLSDVLAEIFQIEPE